MSCHDWTLHPAYEMRYGKSHYPDLPGSKPPVDTSRAAAVEVAETAETLRAECLEVLRTRGPMTADEVAAELGKPIWSVRPRVTELKAKGLAADTGDRRRNESGKLAQVVRHVEPRPKAAPAGPLVQGELL